MKTKSVGIIAEYNPFHNGHLYHLNRSKELTEAEVTVAAISGNFVQRGALAIADKWQRAEAAVKCGVDLVVEIPVVFACNSASNFAKGGVEILENLGCDYISFGTESESIEDLREISNLTDEAELSVKLLVKEGLSYPVARRKSLEVLLGEEKAKFLDSPNNVLAIEYLRHIKSSMPISIKRTGPGYNDREVIDDFASATAIRQLVKKRADISRLLPGKSAEILKAAPKIDEGVLFTMIRHRALTCQAEELDQVSAGGEGLGNKLKNSIRYCDSYEGLIELLKSKRYTRTRIDRFLCHVLLDIKRDKPAQNYIRVLAFNEKGSKYIKEIKKAEMCQLPIITNINKDVADFPQIEYSLSKDILAADIYNMACSRDLYKFSEYVRKPFV